MDQPTLFSEAELSVLRNSRYDPEAARAYDMFSGGFYWSDEGIEDLARASDNYLYRYLIHHRALISEGKSRGPFTLWEQLLLACPNWPGFRPERRAPALASDLEQAWKIAEASILDGME